MTIFDRLIEILRKAPKKGTWVLLSIVGTLLFFTYIALYVVFSIWIGEFLRFPKLFPSPFNVIVSMPILVVGLSLQLWSILEFIKACGTPARFSPPPKLVTTGPYAYFRNPQSTSWFILFIGLGILFQSLSLVFIFTPLFILFSIFQLKRIEEPVLEKRFGKKYIEYKKRTPMYIPRLKVKEKKETNGIGKIIHLLFSFSLILLVIISNSSLSGLSP